MIEKLVVLNGSPSSGGTTAALAGAAAGVNGGGEVIQLGRLDAEALLGRKESDDVDAALRLVQRAGALAVFSPVYRRTYSGLLKTFFDLLGAGALEGIPAVLGVTAGRRDDALCIEHGLRPLISSLGGWSVPTGLCAIQEDFADGEPSEPLRQQLARALAEAESLAGR